MSEIEGIIKQLVKSSPPGNDELIINDIRQLLDGDSTKLLNKLLRSRYTQDDHLKLIETNEGFSILSKYNLQGMKFVDSNQGILFDYDFIQCKVIDIEEIPKDISELQRELTKYVKDQYSEHSYGLVNNNTILICGEKLNDQNYYNGKWESFYEIDEANNKLNYNVKLQIHYYEDGNVMMNSCKSGAIDAGDSIIESIRKFENELQLNLLTDISELNEQKFKNLRRVLPISRSKIQWGKSIGNYKLGQDVAGGREK